MDSNTRRIPVFVFPTTLNFYLNARHTHKQLLTLYNPYDFPVRFKVLCTAPNKFTVIDPDGSIGPQACVDIVIRHTFPIAANCNVTDKFRVTMQDHSTKQVLGKRDIEAKLLQGEPDNSSNDGGDNFQVLPHGERAGDRQSSMQYQYSPRQNQRLSSTNTANYLAIIAGIVSIVALLLPTKPEKQEETSIPTYLHISGNFKLVFAYVLGKQYINVVQETPHLLFDTANIDVNCIVKQLTIIHFLVNQAIKLAEILHRLSPQFQESTLKKLPVFELANNVNMAVILFVTIQEEEVQLQQELFLLSLNMLLVFFTISGTVIQ